MSKRSNRILQDAEAASSPHLALTHGQTLWLMGELGLRQGVSASTFNYYIKSLRKLGIPFEKGKGQSQGRRNVRYDFEELMELTLALLLRVYGWLPDDVANGLRACRNDLRSIYRQAYFDSLKHIHCPACLSTAKGRRIDIVGLFLDLNIRYSAGHIIEFGPPRAISPYEAMRAYADSHFPARAYLPLNMTTIAEMVVTHGHKAPSVRQKRDAAGPVC